MQFNTLDLFVSCDKAIIIIFWLHEWELKSI